jgi:Delta3-Delta2-enoyl-CoA isomerase
LSETLALPSHAMLATRQIARTDLMSSFADVDKLPIDTFIDAFFHEDTQATLQALVARLKSKAK